MPKYDPNDPLDKAIYEGDIEETKRLLNDGAKMPKHYKGKDSGNLINLLTSNENANNGSMVQNITSLPPKQAHDLANLLGYTNKFDTLVEEAVEGGIDPSKKQPTQSEKEEKDRFPTKSDAVVKKRWGISAFVHSYFLNDNNDIDILSRFEKTKEAEFEKAEIEYQNTIEALKKLDPSSRLNGIMEAKKKKKANVKNTNWEEVANLINRCKDIAKANREEYQKEPQKTNSQEPSVTIDVDSNLPIESIEFGEKDETQSTYSDLTEVSREGDFVSSDSSIIPPSPSIRSTSNSSKEKSVRFKLDKSSNQPDEVTSQSDGQSTVYHSAQFDMSDQSYYSGHSDYDYYMSAFEEQKQDNNPIDSRRTRGESEQTKSERVNQAIESLSAFFGISPSSSHVSQVESSTPKNRGK